MDVHDNELAYTLNSYSLNDIQQHNKSKNKLELLNSSAKTFQFHIPSHLPPVLQLIKTFLKHNVMQTLF